jgi:Circularly permutated YpsA SLOG family
MATDSGPYAAARVEVRQNIVIISGGQTGADRAALDFAIAHGIPHGGWCPINRRAEDGPIPAKYSLNETPSTHYAQRTEWNVRDSNATLIFTIKPTLTGGTRLTYALAAECGKPVLHISRDHDGAKGTSAAESDARIDDAAAALRNFLDEHAVRTLNVAGPRSSQEPAIGAFVQQVFENALLD